MTRPAARPGPGQITVTRIGSTIGARIALTAGVDEILRIKREELLTIDGVIEARLTSLHTNHKGDYRWAQRTTG